MFSNSWIRVAGLSLLILITSRTLCVGQATSQPSTEKLPPEQTIDLGNGVTMQFVRVRPGLFLMGDDNEKPVHKVTISKAFYMAKTETTQEQWQAVMGNNPSHFKGAKNPVEQVTWDDCQVFTHKLAEKVSGGHKFRLPTEAQWEYACRAGSTGKFCYGDDEAGLGDYAWLVSNSGLATHAVAQKKSNAWGLYDMHGNVWEWCQDLKGEYPKGEVTDPAGALNGTSRVIRGGAGGFPATNCRSAFRGAYAPDGRGFYNGFRVVLDLSE